MELPHSCYRNVTVRSELCTMSCRDREHQLELVSCYFCKSGNVLKIRIIGNKLRIIHIKGKSLFQLMSHCRCLGFSFCQICYCNVCLTGAWWTVLCQPGDKNSDRTYDLYEANALRMYGCYLVITWHSWVFMSQLVGKAEGDWNTTEVRLLTAAVIVPHSLMSQDDKDL